MEASNFDEISEDDPYGYLMVHFVEDSAGYAEKIYLDISEADSPMKWVPLNNREPILASNLSTTGTRDPFLTYNPETQTYYIIGTDLRVFGGSFKNWSDEQNHGSVMMNVWESKDLITWSEVRQVNVELNANGEQAAYLGMMWAPEATWVPDFYGKGDGAFVVYWSSKVFSDADHKSVEAASDIMWAATKDFTQETWDFGGVMIDVGGTGCIDTSIIQNQGRTYHVTKSYSEIIIMEYTDAEKWWEQNGNWTRVQTNIGGGGSLEGPCVFPSHSDDNTFYLFLDAFKRSGYELMESHNLNSSTGWSYVDMNSDNYFLTPNTKHGGVISLTKKQYDAIRSADIDYEKTTDQLQTNLGTVSIEAGKSLEELNQAMPLADVVTANNWRDASAQFPVNWDFSSVNLSKTGTYNITGEIASIGENKGYWKGINEATGEESELYTSSDKTLYSPKAIAVMAKVNVISKKEEEQKEIINPVTKLDQTITVSSKKVSLSDKAFSLNAKTSGDGVLSYTSSNPKVVTVSSSGKVEIKGSGKSTITVSIPKAELKSIASSKKGKVKVAVKKLNKIKTYQLQISKKKKFTAKDTKSFTISKTTYTASVSKFSKKKVYVRVRAYDSAKKKYGSWSKVLNVKVK